MRVLIFALLALAVNATNYGYQKYYTDYPSHSYAAYPSSYYGGNYGGNYGGIYGSSLYGAGYGLGHSYYTNAYKPAVYHSAKYSYWQPYGTGAEYKSGHPHSGAPGKTEFFLGGTGISTRSDYSKPAVPKDPTKSFHRDSGCAHKTRAHGTAGHSQISFVQDFSKVAGHSGFSAGKQEVHSFKKIAVPVSPVVSREFLSRPVGGAGPIRIPEDQEIFAGQPHIGLKGSRQSQQVKINPEIIHSSDKDSTPVVGTVSRPSSGYVHRTSPVQKAFSPAKDTHMSFTLGQSAHREADVKTFPEISAPVVVPRPSSGSEVAGALSKFPTQGFSGRARPARISFTQDFSRVSGHRNSEVKPIISVDDKLTAPVFPGDIASKGFQTVQRSTVKSTPPVEVKPAQRPVTENLAFTALKQPVVQQPSAGSVYDQSFTHRLFPVQPEGHVPAHKSIFAARPAVDIVDYKHEITTVEGQRDAKLPSFVIVPESGNVHDKSSAFQYSALTAVSGGKLPDVRHSSAGVSGHGLLEGKVSSVSHSGDKSNVFLEVPDGGPARGQSPALLHSTGVATGSFVEEKGSVFEVSSGGVDSTLSKPGQVQGYDIISTPFKNYYSSSYPGYSHVSGESPRFDFSHDRSLLYTYGTPYLANPFSYFYSLGNKYNGQVSTKTFA